MNRNPQQQHLRRKLSKGLSELYLGLVCYGFLWVVALKIKLPKMLKRNTALPRAVEVQ